MGDDYRIDMKLIDRPVIAEHIEYLKRRLQADPFDKPISGELQQHYEAQLLTARIGLAVLTRVDDIASEVQWIGEFLRNRP